MSQLQNQLLNGVLVRIHRGLLSYAGECWPWTNDEEASERDAVSRMVAERNERVAQIAELLWLRRVPTLNARTKLVLVSCMVP